MIRSLMMVFGLSLALTALGCDSGGDGNGGSGGTAGSGGSGGSGGEGGGVPLPTDACDNPDDLSALEGGDEPPTSTSTACSTLAATTNPEYCDPDSTALGACLLDGNGGTSEASTLSEDCARCFAEISCCTIRECSVLVGGPCAGPPTPGDACDTCLRDNCASEFQPCAGIEYP